MDPNPRRRRLIAYIEGRLKRLRGLKQTRNEWLMANAGLNKSRASQVLGESYPFREAAARRLAFKLGLDDDYFEHDHPEGGVAVMVSLAERPQVLAFIEGLRARAAHVNGTATESGAGADAANDSRPGAFIDTPTYKGPERRTAPPPNANGSSNN